MQPSRDRRWLLLGALALASCGQRIDVVARGLDPGEMDGAAAPGSGAGEGGSAETSGCPHAQRTGLTLAGDGSLDSLAVETRARGLCTCGDYSGAQRLSIEAGGAAIDGSLQLNGEADLVGDLAVAGAVGWMLGAGRVTVDGSLAVAGPVLGSEADLRVTGDVAVGGRIQLAALEVGGTLTLPPGAGLDVAQGADPPATTRGDVHVAAMCGCGTANQLDPEAVRELATDGDDLRALKEGCGAVRLMADALPAQVEAPRGGLLVIDGDLRLPDALAIAMSEGASLDLVVLGNASSDALLALGAPGAGRVRLFVTGNGTLELRDGGALHGLVHAPNAELVLAAPLEVRGSLLVRRVAASATLTISGE